MFVLVARLKYLVIMEYIYIYIYLCSRVMVMANVLDPNFLAA